MQEVGGRSESGGGWRTGAFLVASTVSVNLEARLSAEGVVGERLEV